MKPGILLKAENILPWSLLALMVSAEVLLLYGVPRSSFMNTYGLILILFVLYFYILRNQSLFSFSTCIGLAVILRIIAVFNSPVLSDDYFRFIWDGKMTMAHINPFQFTPTEYIHSHPQNTYLEYLLANMNSQDYHTIYPPVLQYLFAFCVWIFPTNAYGAMVMMKLFILTGELVTMRFLYKYAIRKNIDVRNILWYILNPLIIVELTGNVHFEGVLVCFFIAFLYWLDTGRYKTAAIYWALAISTKIIPVLLAPVLFRYLGFKKFLTFSMVAFSVIVLLLFPYVNLHFIQDFNSSARLFYHLFEFNAPVFYLIRALGYHYVNYDIIEEVAPKLALISFFLILVISWWPAKKIAFETKCLWAFSVYFVFSTMVHPWYPAILILLSVFSRYKFPVIFSLLIPLSYFPYSLREYDENMWIILLEYSLLLVFMLVETRFIARKEHSPLSLNSADYSVPN